MNSMKQNLITKENALPGRTEAITLEQPHLIFNNKLDQTPTSDQKTLILGMGCFWGAERLFWQQPGVINTAVGYAGGITPNPTYNEVCTGLTGHAEVVKIIFNPDLITVEQLLSIFWENHNPTAGMRQGNDIGTQYRSTIYATNSEQYTIALASRNHYQQALIKENYHSSITTEIKITTAFFFAEEEHQQYLAKHPDGYCGLKGLNICQLSTK